MTNFDRILAEARELLNEDERLKLSLALVPEEMSADERAALEQAIEEGFEDFDKGHFSDARSFAEQLSAKR